MSSMSQDPDTQKMHEMIMKYFDLNDLRELYFSLGIDWEGVPQPANKPQYVRYLLRFVGSNQDQDLLLSKLAKLRPRLFWPKTFSIPVAAQSTASPGSISIGTVIGRQNVNINVTQVPPTPRLPKPIRRRQKESRNQTKTSKTEVDLFNEIFVYTKMYVFLALIIFIIFPIALGVWIYLNKDIWQIDGLLFFLLLLFVFSALVIMYKLAFRMIYNKVLKFTDFYQINVNSRSKIKGNLQNRHWGSIFWNLMCKFFIELFLQPNKNKANKISRLKF